MATITRRLKHLTETSIKLVDQASKEQEQQSSDGETRRCKSCDGQGWQTVYLDVQGEVIPRRINAEGFLMIPEHYKSAVIECRCLRTARCRAMLERIPEEFQRKTLWNTKARADKHKGQAEVIPFIKANPLEGYLICGVSGAGKNHLSWGVARYALAHDRIVFSINAPQWLDDCVASGKENSEVSSIEPLSVARVTLAAIQPPLLANALRRMTKKACLLVHEFDKPNASQFASKKMLELLDSVYECHHQLIVTSNERRSFLESHWSNFSQSFGRPIMRRIDACCDCVEMF